MNLCPTFAAAMLVAMLPFHVLASPLGPGADVRGQAVAINDANQIAGFLEFGPFGSLPRHAFFADGPDAIDIGTLGGTSSAAVAISENGLVVGWSYLAGGDDMHAFLYQNGVMTDLGTLGGSESFPYDVNSAGDVVGWSWLAGDSEKHAFLYRSGAMIDLGTLGGSDSVALAVNEAGQVVGSAQLAGDTQTHAFAWTASSMTDLGTLGGTFSEARALNETGSIVGSSKVAGDSASHAFLYSGGMMQDLGTLGGSNSDALDINESDAVAGGAEIAGGDIHPFVWSEGVMVDLVASTPSTGSFAMAIGDNGEAVGLVRRIEAGTPVERAFSWSAGTLDVQEEGLSSIAWDINSAGHAVGAFTEEPDPEFPALVSRPAIWLGRCGNGSIDLGEECDDADIWSDDCCSASCEAAAPGSACETDANLCSIDVCDDSAACVHLLEPRPSDGCLASEASRFQVKDDGSSAKDRVAWRWSSIGPVGQSDLGAPDVATTYALCIWDHITGVPALAARSTSGSATLWTSRDPSGWIYRAGDGPPSGLRSLQIKLKSDGSAKLKLSAGGASLSMPTPVSASSYFAVSPGVVVQLVASNGLCFTSEFSSVQRNDVDRFSARTP